MGAAASEFRCLPLFEFHFSLYQGVLDYELYHLSVFLIAPASQQLPGHEARLRGSYPVATSHGPLQQV